MGVSTYVRPLEAAGTLCIRISGVPLLVGLERRRRAQLWIYLWQAARLDQCGLYRYVSFRDGGKGKTFDLLHHEHSVPRIFCL